MNRILLEMIQDPIPPRNISIMASTTEVKLLQDNLILVFGEPDQQKRLTKMSELWTLDCVFVDPAGAFRGYEEISRLIGSLQDQNPGKIFTKRGTGSVM